MIKILISRYLNDKNKIILSFFIIIYLWIGIYFLTSYFILDINVLTGFLLTPYLIMANPDRRGATRYLWVALLFLLLAWFTMVLTFYYFAIGFTILFVIECFAGRLNYLPVFLMGVISPTFKYFNGLFGFPIRLKLSEIAGKTLQFAGFKNEVSGNVIMIKGAEFSVDPACVGLKMMAISIIIGLFLMAYYQRKTGRQLNFLFNILVVIGIIVLNIICNLLRIIMLIFLKIMPENPFHDVIGTLCLIFYVIIPIIFLIKWLYIHNKNITVTSKQGIFKPQVLLFFNLIMVISILCTGFIKLNEHKENYKSINICSIDGYTQKIVYNDVIKLEKPGILLYMKPLNRFYGAEHNPMICWIGSGYHFNRINKQFIANQEIYTGILKKGSDIIYTAWWFDNGEHKTISQLDWRIRALKGENFYLLNINSTNKNQLDNEIQYLLAKKLRFFCSK